MSFRLYFLVFGQVVETESYSSSYSVLTLKYALLGSINYETFCKENSHTASIKVTASLRTSFSDNSPSWWSSISLSRRQHSPSKVFCCTFWSNTYYSNIVFCKNVQGVEVLFSRNHVNRCTVSFPP